MRILRVRRSLPLLIILMASLAASAQYFGQNKVRYKTLDFKVLKTTHFDIYYYPEEAQMATEVGRMSERWYARLSQLFNYDLSSRQPVILYASAPDFRSTNVIPGDIGEATGGVTEPLKRRVVIPLAGPLADTDHVLGHELVHAFQYDIAARGIPQSSGLENSGLQRLPLWFIEGMAEYLSLGPADPNTAMWMRDAVAQNKLPKIKDLNNPKYFPYRWGQALWAYIGGTYGDKSVGELLRSAARSGDVKSAFKAVLQKSDTELTDEWQHALRSHFAPVLEETTPADQQARLLISKAKHGGGSTLNTSPVLSPDGKQMVFFSAKGLFSIDLYLADAQTGHIKRKLTSTAINPHLDSLEFINSAGAWSHDGRYLAFGQIVDGRPQIAVRDMQAEKTVEHIRLPELGEVYTPTWSPDGKQIAFSAMVNGMTDLFVVDRQSKKLKRLTNDAFADLQPAWSPDGSSIVFVTDRFHTDISDLSYGRMELALLHLDSGKIEALPAFTTGRNTNPQWSPDGKSVYFISDRDGVANVYRLSLADRQLFQLTNIQTGIAGITPLSPAISVATKDGHLVYSAFIKDDYNIYSVDTPAALAGQALNNALADRMAGVLPPTQKNMQSTVAALLKNTAIGLPEPSGFTRTPYKPHLQLDYVAPPNVGVGYSSFGPLVSGGTGLYFSDLLGERNLLLSIQSSSFGSTGSFYRNLAGLAAWQNQHSRWNWGFVGGQVPYITAGLATATTTVNGVPVFVEQDITFWQLNREIAALASYPFNRAARVEFSAGYNNVGFAAEADTFAFAPDGSLISEQRSSLPTPSALNLATASAAYVYDTSVFGGTSPVMGQRYRIELDGAGGTLNFSTVLADYRRYFRLARPVSLAGRVLHYGRYGGDSDDNRLQDIFVGYSSLVHGYDPNSFSPAECGPQLQVNGSCPVFDQLVGSKVAVGNAEARLELLGPLGIIPSKPIPPVQAAWFYDTGEAWTGASRAGFLGGPRSAVSSYGAALRVNILGYAVGEISLAHPNDRPGRNWIWQFSLVPGW
jgi:WD40 repeat protein